MRFSLIVPIYNRPDEAAELLESLALQTCRDFELVLAEDGSDRPCAGEVEAYRERMAIRYIVKENTGRSDTRNVAMKQAKGDYFIFLDSDCIVPPHYLATVERLLEENYVDCFGGPDAGHASFSDVQKAVNYAMTSFWTTGGIRGGKVKMEKFKPRTFNMGFSRAVYEKTGGFRDMYGEDIDLSIRIEQAGFTTGFYREAFVYHKRRVNLKKFGRQVYVFGQARVNLGLLHPGSLKVVHTLPALLVAGSGVIIVAAAVFSPGLLMLPAAGALLLFADALRKTKSFRVAGWAVPASFIQIFGYGCGFIRAFIRRMILRKGPDEGETIRKVYK
jgi:GT2 family glycosyltransferase